MGDYCIEHEVSLVRPLSLEEALAAETARAPAVRRATLQPERPRARRVDRQAL